jgi:hypothetical protein
MSEWTEYHPGLEWPEGGHVSWQYLSPSGWHNTYNAAEHWSTGTRVRYCIAEIKTREQLKDKSWEDYPYTKTSEPEVFYDGFDAGWKAARENPEVEV